MVFVEFMDGLKTKLALVEKPEVFLERTCSDTRKEIQTEIGELLPPTFCFVLWGSPLSLVQESMNVLKKCAVQVTVPVVENHSSGYPENIQLFRVEIHAFESQDSSLSASTHCRPVSVQGSVPGRKNSSSLCSVSTTATKVVDHLINNLNEEKNSLHYRLEIAQATVSSLKEKPKERPFIGRNVNFTCSNCHYKGHRVTSCREPSCQGYMEFGNTVLHKEHRDVL